MAKHTPRFGTHQTKPTCFPHQKGKPQTSLAPFLVVFLDVHQDSGCGVALTELCSGVGQTRRPISASPIPSHRAGTGRTDGRGLARSQHVKHHHLSGGQRCAAGSPLCHPVGSSQEPVGPPEPQVPARSAHPALPRAYLACSFHISDALCI